VTGALALLAWVSIGWSTPTGAGSAATLAPPDMRGEWRMDLYIVSHTRIPVLGTTTVLSHTLFNATVDGTPEAPVLHTRPCGLFPQTTRPIASTTIPQAFVDKMPRKAIPFSVTEDGDVWQLQADMRRQDVGWHRPGFVPDEPGQTVPHTAENAAIRDFEADGHPGATIYLNAPIFGQIDIYMLQTAHTEISASWDGGDFIEGPAHVLEFAHRSIGASNRLFMANPDIEMDSAQSRWRLSRVPAGTTCAALKTGAGQTTPLSAQDVRPRD
jgi:hypothetical protein